MTTASGERIFSKYQYGLEAANAQGTAVAATKVLVGADQKPVPNHMKVIYPEDNLGVRYRAARSAVTGYLVEDSISVARMYYEGLPLFFGCSLKGAVVANTTDGVSTWNFTPDANDLNDPDSFTLEAGDNVQAYTMEYGMFKSLKLSGEIDQGGGESAIKLDAAYFARQVSKDNFTANLTLGTYTAMSAKQTLFYDDDSWGAVGNTAIANTLRGFDIELNVGNHPKFFGSSNLYFDTHGEGFVDAMVTLTLEGNAAAVAIYDEWVAQSFQVIRLKIVGPTIGNTNTTHALTLDFGGTWESVTPLSGESNNNNLYQALFHTTADTSLANGVQCTVVTDTNTV